MNEIKQVFLVLFLVCTAVMIQAQNAVEAGANQTIYCSGSVQLNATPLNGWANLDTYTTNGFNSIFFTSENTGVAVGNTGTILITHDGGNTWSGSPLSGIYTLYSVYFINSTTGFITGSSGLIVKTTDGGNTWTPQTSGTTEQLRAVYFTSVNTGYIVSNGGTILKTTNGGTTWTPLVSGITSSLYAVNFTSANTGYVAGASGTLFKTTDAGATWNSQSAGTTNTLYSICFPTATNGFVSGSEGTILKTTDGINWNRYAADSIYTGTSTGEVSKTNGRLLKTSSLNSVCFTSPTTGYMTGSYVSGSIFLKTLDAGASWFELASNANTKMSSISFPTGNVGYASGGKGVIAKISESEIQPCTYSWLPTEGLSNPNIANPVASPTRNTTYTVVATQGYNTFSDSLKVSIEPLTINIGTNKKVGCEGSVKLDSVKTNYTGPGRLRYKWFPSKGLSSDTIANPISSVTDSTTYSLTVSTPNNCSAQGSVTVEIGPLTVTPTVDKTVICSGTAQLLAITNYSGKSALHYTWTPAAGLSNDTIANPIATVSNQTVYTVHVASGIGCSATGSVTIKVANLTANAGADKTINCGEKVQLDAVTTNYNGTGVLHYKWTPSVGLSSDTVSNPIVTGGNTTVYQVKVTAPSGCTATDNVNIFALPITLSVGADKTASCGSQVQLGVTSTSYAGTGLKYKWTPSTGLNNDTIANPVAIASNITYTLSATTPSGCTATDQVSIRIIPMDKPVLNYVGINGNNKNILVWTKPTIGKINSYNVYKETNVTNSYTMIGTVSFDAACEFVDNDSKPDVQSNKYKISIKDACDNETTLSDYHKTMHLSINKGINTIWNLIWEAYEGYPVSTYNIYRGTTPENIQIIGSLSGSNTQFSDYTAPSGYVYYQIEATGATASGAKQQTVTGIKSLMETTYSSRSNIATNKSGIDGLSDLKDISNVLSVYPNPATNSIHLVVGEYDLKDMKINIYNTLGTLVLTKESVQPDQKININNLNNGIYLLEVISDKYSGIQKLIIRQ